MREREKERKGKREERKERRQVSSPAAHEESCGVRCGEQRYWELERERARVREGREGGKEEEHHTEAHIICPGSEGSHSDIICKIKKEEWRCSHMSLPFKKTVTHSSTRQDQVHKINSVKCNVIWVINKDKQGCQLIQRITRIHKIVRTRVV